MPSHGCDALARDGASCSTARNIPLHTCPHAVAIGRSGQQLGQRRGHARATQPTPGSRRCLRVQAATKEEEKLGSDPLAELDSNQFPFQPRRSKFQPFIGESDVRDLLMSYRHKVAVRGGVLHIAPMRTEHVRDASELLADSFSEAVGYMPVYKGFLRRQVDEYLRSHIDIAPKAVILVAILKPEAEGEWDGLEADSLSSERRATWFEKQERRRDEAEAETAPRGPISATASSSPPVTSVAELAQRSLDAAEAGALPSGPLEFEAADGSSSDSDSLAPASLQQRPQQQPAAEASLRGDGGDGSAAQGSELEMREAAGVGERPAGGGPAAEAEAAEVTKAAERERAAQGEIVGTVELSFAASTRTPAVTLNPPPDQSYLCNMAVGEAHQRKGYGLRILSAAEEVVRLAGFRRVYLHVRLKDEPARGLYAKAGYELEKEDCFFVQLWDHRRRLLSKFIPQQPTLPQPPLTAAADEFPVEREY